MHFALTFNIDFSRISTPMSIRADRATPGPRTAVARLLSAGQAVTAQWPAASAASATALQAVANAHLELQFTRGSLGPLAGVPLIHDRFQAQCLRTLRIRREALGAAWSSLLGPVVECALALDAVLGLPAGAWTATPLFKTASLERIVDWVLQFLAMYVSELACKHRIWLACGGPDLWSTSDLVACLDAWSRLSPPTPSVGAQITSFQSARISGLVDLTTARHGRLAALTEDTLSLYLSAWINEPYVDSVEATIILDCLSYECA